MSVSLAKFLPLRAVCLSKCLLTVLCAWGRGGGPLFDVVKQQNCNICGVLYHPADDGLLCLQKSHCTGYSNVELLLLSVKIRSLVKMSHGLGIMRLKSQLYIFK